MRNFQYTFETRKRSFISAFLICMTAPLTIYYVIIQKPKSARKPEEDVTIKFCKS